MGSPDGTFWTRTRGGSRAPPGEAASWLSTAAQENGQEAPQSRVLEELSEDWSKLNLSLFLPDES